MYNINETEAIGIIQRLWFCWESSKKKLDMML